MNKRDIILIAVPFTDLSDKKLRPALVLGKIQEDLLCCFLSSRLDTKRTQDVTLKKNSRNGLKTDSVIKCGKLFTLHQALVERYLGTVDHKIYHQVIQKIIRIIQ